MKKFSFLFCVAFLLMQTQNAYAQFGQFVNHYFPGVIYYNDGHAEEYRWVEIPKGNDDNVIVSNDEKKKNKEKISAIDIHHVSLWSEKEPDSISTLFHIRSIVIGKNPSDFWGVLYAGSAWGVVINVYDYYNIDKKYGYLVGYRNTGFGNMPNPIRSFLLRAGEELAVPLMMNYAFMNYKKNAEYFKENPKIYSGIKNKKLYGRDIKYILDEMAGGVPVQQTQSAPAQSEHKVEAAENGVVGDDE